jgi:hypothetical protein
MERDQVPLDGSHDKLVCKMQSTTERDRHQRVFPDPMPSTHRLAYRWTDEMQYEVYLEPRPELVNRPAPPQADPEEPAANSEERRAQLMRKNDNELSTRAAELGLNKNTGYRGSKAQRVALILAREQAKAEPHEDELVGAATGLKAEVARG